MTQRAIIFGDSHVSAMVRYRDAVGAQAFDRAFRHAFQLRLVYNGMIALNLSLDLADGSWVRNPIFAAKLAEVGVLNPYSLAPEPLVKNTTLVILLGSGESHLLAFQSAFRDFQLGGVDESRKYLPPEIIEATVLHRLRKMGRVLRQLAGYGYPVVLLTGPPPHRDNDRVESLSKFVNIAHADTRLQIYQGMCKALETIATGNKAQFIASSRWLADEDGFLRTEFEHDGVHVGAEGGRAVLAGLDDLLS